MFKKDRLNGLTGSDLVIALADGASQAGAPFGNDVMNVALQLSEHDSWKRFDGVPEYQQTAIRVIMGAVENARRANDQQAMVEAAVFGAALMGRLTEKLAKEQPG